jgi:hypothetical protein
MNSRSSKPPSPRNPQTYLQHRKEVFWQITIPVTIGAVILLSVGLIVAFGATSGTLSQMADAALVELIVPALFFGLITLAILGGTVYGVTRLLAATPYFFMKVQIFFLRTQLTVIQVNDRLVEPVLSVHSFTARMRAFRRSVRRAFWFH